MLTGQTKHFLFSLKKKIARNDWKLYWHHINWDEEQKYTIICLWVCLHNHFSRSIFSLFRRSQNPQFTIWLFSVSVIYPITAPPGTSELVDNSAEQVYAGSQLPKGKETRSEINHRKRKGGMNTCIKRTENQTEEKKRLSYQVMLFYQHKVLAWISSPISKLALKGILKRSY